ncbi:MAG: hypothetical protein AM326_04375 [Candidatus Thorarchaeota archaeon SMTZ-45]|nr:MAG: hypothetical protein AM326_04375 [Candidatus Thorarchaeota archaeon SMTZ-45]KXH75793.1 MAG: hypothetical protein AM325_03920 [Candidatus Thorarchaeota archaeon SMTZ1-45]
MSEICLIVTVSVVALTIWMGVLSGNLKKSIIWKKPLLVPSLVFIFALIVAMAYVPTPMSVYHGPNQEQEMVDLSITFSTLFTVYEANAYDSELQVRVPGITQQNEYIEVFFGFYQDREIISSLFINITEGIQDQNGWIIRNIVLDPGFYNITINGTYYDDGVSQDNGYIEILVNQPISSEFIPEITAWSSYLFLLGISCLVLLLGGVCIGRVDKTRTSEERIDQEPPREGEVYGRKLGW